MPPHPTSPKPLSALSAESKINDILLSMFEFLEFLYRKIRNLLQTKIQKEKDIQIEPTN